MCWWSQTWPPKIKCLHSLLPTSFIPLPEIKCWTSKEIFLLPNHNSHAFETKICQRNGSPALSNYLTCLVRPTFAFPWWHGVVRLMWRQYPILFLCLVWSWDFKLWNHKKFWIRNFQDAIKNYYYLALITLLFYCFFICSYVKNAFLPVVIVENNL